MTTASERAAERAQVQEVLRIPVNVDQYVRESARTEGLQVAREHELSCPVRLDHTEVLQRIQKLEMRLSTLIAFMLGSGLLGGAAGAALVKAMMSGSP